MLCPGAWGKPDLALGGYPPGQEREQLLSLKWPGLPLDWDWHCLNEAHSLCHETTVCVGRAGHAVIGCACAASAIHHYHGWVGGLGRPVTVKVGRRFSPLATFLHDDKGQPACNRRWQSLDGIASVETPVVPCRHWRFQAF